MSQQNSYPIRCPKCGHEQTVSLYDAINVKESPELRAELMANKLNGITCAACGFGFRVDKNLVYSDPDRKLLVFWVPTDESDYARGEEQFVDLLGELSELLPDDLHAPSVHLVFNRVELIERIFLVEAGLDERLVEYIKYTLYSRNAARLDPAKKILLFNATDSTPEHLCFVVQDAATRKFEAMLQYERAAYTALAETFSGEEKSADLLELFPGPHISARALLLREQQESETPEPPAAPGS
ncbi:MAG TPA: CpXC domain-containing protein [Kiritimatiellia bacterium]|nr:CpXC domain-containing protein [Kiritimatiellia bacterium]